MRRRDIVAWIGGAFAWPFAVVNAQQATLPVVAVVNTGSANGLADRAAAFRKGLSETGFVEGQNVTVEYHWLEGQTDRLPAVMADLTGRKVSVIAAPVVWLRPLRPKPPLKRSQLCLAHLKTQYE